MFVICNYLGKEVIVCYLEDCFLNNKKEGEREKSLTFRFLNNNLYDFVFIVIVIFLGRMILYM